MYAKMFYELDPRDKHYSLLHKLINDGRKNFYNSGYLMKYVSK